MKNTIILILAIGFASCKKDNDAPEPNTEPNPIDTIEVINQCYAGFESDLQVNFKNGQVNFNNLSTEETNYLWDFGNGQTSTERDPSIIYNQAGVYSITLIVSNSKYSDTLVREDYITIQDSSLYVIGDLMVMPVDLGMYAYSTASYIGAADSLYGEQNTYKIATNQYIDTNSCAGYKAYNFTAYGYDDWYLPAIDEMRILYENQNEIGNFTHDVNHYVTSTEYSINKCFFYVMYGITPGAAKYNKGHLGHVRLVRKID